MRSWKPHESPGTKTRGLSAGKRECTPTRTSTESTDCWQLLGASEEKEGEAGTLLVFNGLLSIYKKIFFPTHPSSQTKHHPPYLSGLAGLIGRLSHETNPVQRCSTQLKIHLIMVDNYHLSCHAKPQSQQSPRFSRFLCWPMNSLS